MYVAKGDASRNPKDAPGDYPSRKWITRSPCYNGTPGAAGRRMSECGALALLARFKQSTLPEVKRC